MDTWTTPWECESASHSVVFPEPGGPQTTRRAALSCSGGDEGGSFAPVGAALAVVSAGGGLEGLEVGLALESKRGVGLGRRRGCDKRASVRGKALVQSCC